MKRSIITNSNISKNDFPKNLNQRDFAFSNLNKKCLINSRLMTVLFIFVININLSFAQIIFVDQEQIAVQLTAEIQIGPPKVILSWKNISYGPPIYTKIYRKAKYDKTWSLLDSLVYSNTDTTYADSNVKPDSSFEYMVLIGGGPTTCPDGDFTIDGSLSVGFIHVGLNAPPIHEKGTLILLVENTIADSCTAEIKTLMDDIRGDGWQIIKHNLPKSGFNLRTADPKVLTTKDLIVNDYKTYPKVKAVLILGHIAVPYSGWKNPDGHAEHRGAWPADAYYGDIDGIWTDNIVNDSTAIDVDPNLGNTHLPRLSNWNTPGDGKFDQDVIPSEVELQVSRIDLSNMPAFPDSEIQMIKNYLNKDHAYKMNEIHVRRKGIWCDWISWSNKNCRPLSSNGFRNCAPLIGRDSLLSAGVYKDMLIPALSAKSYQWVFGVTFGWNTSTSGMGSTANMVGKPNYSIFSFYDGSYFGDWDFKNNYMRGPLCQNPPTLTSCYGGSSSNWFFQHMAIGENIGYSTIITQNNGRFKVSPGLYKDIWPDFEGEKTISLLGDLTLRTDYIKPITGLTITSPSENEALLTWNASSEPDVLGYHVYRSDSEYGFYKRLTDTMLKTLTYNDIMVEKGIKYYMVRPVKLTLTASGTYYNLGIGAADSITIESSSSIFKENQAPFNLLVYPNPTNANTTIQFFIHEPLNILIQMTDMQGKRVFSETKKHFIGKYEKKIDLRMLNKGMYTIEIQTENGKKSKVLILI